MTVAVAIAGDDQTLVESVSLAVERDGDLYVAPAVEQAQALLVTPESLERVAAPDGCALVVLAARDHIGAARAALRAKADGILAWPDDSGRLAAGIAAAVGRRVAASGRGGLVVCVVGVRGGAGATTIAAQLAFAARADGFLLDLRGGPAGQAVYTGDEPAAAPMLGSILSDPSPDALRRVAGDHAAGVPCVYADGASAPSRRLAECLRLVAGTSVVDGAIAGADVTLLIVGADVGSVRSAASTLEPDGPGRTEIVLNKTGRGRVRARDVERALGVKPLAVVPFDPRLARAADLGGVARHGPGARALRALAQKLR